MNVISIIEIEDNIYPFFFLNFFIFFDIEECLIVLLNLPGTIFPFLCFIFVYIQFFVI